MKKFSFSLQKVLEIKEQILENSKIEMSNLNEINKKIDLEIVNLNDKFLEVNSEFLEKSAVGVSVGEMTYYKIYMSSILKQIDGKEKEKNILAKKIEAKRQEILNKKMEISSLEKLKEKEHEKYNGILLKSEEIFIEEFISNKSMTKGYIV